jgi:hypothetical protein
MREDDEREQEPTRRSRYDEELGGGDLLDVITEERTPLP